MKMYFMGSVIVGILAVVSIISAIIHRKKMSEVAVVSIMLLSVLIFVVAVVFAMCIGFFMR